MKIAVFAIQYKIKFDSYSIDKFNRPPEEIRSELRNSLFDELINSARENKVNLAVLPAGFFRSANSSGIANRLNHYPPGIHVLVGWDNLAGGKREVWVVKSDGQIQKRIAEAWKCSGKFDRNILNTITNRRFRVGNKNYAVFCCGDILIDNEQNAGRKPPNFIYWHPTNRYSRAKSCAFWQLSSHVRYKK